VVARARDVPLPQRFLFLRRERAVEELAERRRQRVRRGAQQSAPVEVRFDGRRADVDAVLQMDFAEAGRLRQREQVTLVEVEQRWLPVPA
jgi:hypothetical protein